MKRSRRTFVLLAAAWLGGCARKAKAPPPPELAAEDHLPSSLDLVLRVDLGKLRRALPDLGELSRSAARGDDDDARAKVVDILATRGREIWIGARDRTFEDLVIAANGDFELLDLGPSFIVTGENPSERVLERAAAKRSGPAWILHKKSSLVIVTPGMLDAVSRTRAKGERSVHDVPRDGVIGFSAKARALVGESAAQKPPFASMALAEGSLDIEGGLLRGTLLASFKSDADADHAEKVANALLERARERGNEEMLAGVTVVRRSSSRIAITVKLPAAQIRKMLGRA